MTISGKGEGEWEVRNRHGVSQESICCFHLRPRMCATSFRRSLVTSQRRHGLVRSVSWRRASWAGEGLSVYRSPVSFSDGQGRLANCFPSRICTTPGGVCVRSLKNSGRRVGAGPFLFRAVTPLGGSGLRLRCRTELPSWPSRHG